MILEETYTYILAKYAEKLRDVTIEKLVAGIYFTAVKLSSGYSGLAYTNLEALDCCSKNRKNGFGVFTPGNFSGQKVADLFSIPAPSCLVKTIQLAAMNAISAELIDDSSYRIIENQDPIEMLNFEGKKKVCLVGAFLSYIKKIAESDSDLKIIELNENAVPEEYRRLFVSSEHSASTISESDIVIITGASLSNDTIDGLLDKISSDTQVVLVGPTSSLLPDVLFKRGINLIGATRITDADKMLELVAEGAAGFHLFKYCATKICIVNEH